MTMATSPCEFLRNQPPCPPGVPSSRSPCASTCAATTPTGRGGPAPLERWKRRQPPAGTTPWATCTLCPGMWPPHMDYNYARDRPARTTGASRRATPCSSATTASASSPRADPWNLMFRFQLLERADSGPSSTTPASEAVHQAARTSPRPWRCRRASPTTSARAGLEGAAQLPQPLLARHAGVGQVDTAGHAGHRQTTLRRPRALAADVVQGAQGRGVQGMVRPASARRGQAGGDGARDLVFVTVLVFGIHFAEVGYLSLKVQEATASALWDATSAKMHSLPGDFSALHNLIANDLPGSPPPPLRELRWALPRTAGGAPVGRSSPRPTGLEVTCEAGSGISFSAGAPPRASTLTRAACAAPRARCSPPRVSLTESFLDQGPGAFFEVTHYNPVPSPMCGTGRRQGRRLQTAASPSSLDDWALAGSDERRRVRCCMARLPQQALLRVREEACTTSTTR